MKNSLPALLFSFLLFSVSVHAQIEKVIVETYYISDSLDATDVQYVSDISGNIIDSVSLPVGSRTYRVYVDLKPGFKLTKIYGNAKHRLKISSDSSFFNHVSFGQSFGNMIAINKVLLNPTLALDSWLTLGKAATTLSGILKTEDINGCITAIKNNKGGSSNIPGGLLHNVDPAVGIPLDSADGLVNSPAVSFLSDGILEADGKTDSTIFGSLKPGTQFISNTAYLAVLNSSGIMGTTDSNKVLVAQLTTKGEISFELNMELWIDDGSLYGKTINYVAKSDGQPTGDTLISPYLTYPYIQACGCKDPDYLEYNASLVCSVNDSCKTHIVFGCMDPLSCNYDPKANFNVPSLCCYPGHCSDRDINMVCPSLVVGRKKLITNFYPNPAREQITFELSSTENKEVRYVIYDSFGRVVLEKNIGMFSGTVSEPVNVFNLNAGIYMYRLFNGDDVSDNIMFMKK